MELPKNSLKQIATQGQTLTDKELVALHYDWYGMHARDKQKPPGGDWLTWMVLAGRGWGKSKTAAEWIRHRVETGKAMRIALVAPTSADNRDVQVEGESGLLRVSPPWFRPTYESSKRRVTWPNGAIATLYSAEEPDRLNGPQSDCAWCDELGIWRYARETWDMLQLGLRLGESRQIVTTTPKVQNVSLIKRIMGYSSTVTVTGSTYENMENLSAAFKQMVLSTYEGTRLGQQELYAKILEDVPGALWTRDIIEAHRVKDHPRLVRIVVAIDPATTSTEESCETGIIVAGRGDDGHGYVLGDLTRRDTPRGWAGVAIGAYEANNADRIVAEVNNGGDMVEAVIRSVDSSVAYKKVNASRGKRARAEPISALYEQGRIHHVGMFDDLEDQLCSYTPESKDSPDRMDALVWAFTELMLKDNSGWLETWGTGEKRELSLPEMTGSRRL